MIRGTRQSKYGMENFQRGEGREERRGGTRVLEKWETNLFRNAPC